MSKTKKEKEMTIKDELLNTLGKSEGTTYTIPNNLTILPLRDIVIFPNMIFPVLIGRTSSLKAVAEAVERDKYIFVTAQKAPNIDEPAFKDIYTKGTTAKIIQILRLPNNLLKVLIEGLFQSRITKKLKNEEFLEATITPTFVKFSDDDKELQALIRYTSDLFADYVKNNHSMPPEIVAAYENIDDPQRKLYYAAANVQTKVEIKQKLLELPTVEQQYFELSTKLNAEI
ncbi:MAG: ATP-dependent Lon protease [Bacteroidota bacterium]|nr:ATP-dependent Lon protease [Bacteroidota bacterium]